MPANTTFHPQDTASWLLCLLVVLPQLQLLQLLLPLKLQRVSWNLVNYLNQLFHFTEPWFMRISYSAELFNIVLPLDEWTPVLVNITPPIMMDTNCIITGYRGKGGEEERVGVWKWRRLHGLWSLWWLNIHISVPYLFKSEEYISYCDSHELCIFLSIDNTMTTSV